MGFTPRRTRIIITTEGMNTMTLHGGADGDEAWKLQIPNPKSQINFKSQASNSKGVGSSEVTATFERVCWSLEFGVWSLFGIWILDFGFCLPDVL
jgi:hypothetical protein